MVTRGALVLFVNPRFFGSQIWHARSGRHNSGLESSPQSPKLTSQPPKTTRTIGQKRWQRGAKRHQNIAVCTTLSSLRSGVAHLSLLNGTRTTLKVAARTTRTLKVGSGYGFTITYRSLRRLRPAGWERGLVGGFCRS